MPLMTLREYARHRGCSLSAVQTALNDRRISIAKTEPHGKRVWKYVDSQQADRDWQSKTSVDQQRNPTRAEMGVQTPGATRTPTYSEPDSEQTELLPELTAPPQQEKQPEPPQSQDLDYHQERAKRERFAAKTAELEYYEKVKKLVHVDSLKVALFNHARNVQQNLLSVPSRVSPILVSYLKKVLEEVRANPDSDIEIDKKEVEDIIDGELKIVLRRIGDVGNTI